MRVLFLAIALLIASPTFAQQPEKTYSFQLTTSQANTILQALGNMPYNASAPIIAEMQKQAQAADKATADKPAIPSPPKKP